MHLVVFAPTQKSLYARRVAHRIILEPDLNLSAIVVRSIWSFRRFRSDLRRDGPRLLRKIRTKLLFTEQSSDNTSGKGESSGVNNALPPDLKSLGQKFSIPCITFRDFNSTDAAARLKALSPDLIVFTGGGLIRENILSIPSLGVMNCHAGILPEYRGMDVVEWPILEEGPERAQVGLTLHLMDRGVDTGPVLLKHRETMLPDESLSDLRKRLEGQMVDLVLEGILKLHDGSLEAVPQAEQDGRQYYVMHPRLKEVVSMKLQGKEPL